MPVRCGAKRLVESAGVNDSLASASRQMRHRAAAPLAEGGGKTSCLWQVVARDGRLAADPAQRGGFDDHLGRMRGSRCLAAARAMAVQKVIEGTLDLEGDLAAEAASAKCCH